jgi:hypothetical protein
MDKARNARNIVVTSLAAKRAYSFWRVCEWRDRSEMKFWLFKIELGIDHVSDLQYSITSVRLLIFQSDHSTKYISDPDFQNNN